MRDIACTLLFLLSFFLVAPALAHVELLDPPARYDRDDLKDGPCGIFEGVRGETIRTYVAGETIALEIDEFINHPSHYRVALDFDGDDDLSDPVCTANCDDDRLPPPEFEDVFDDPSRAVLLGNFEDLADRAQTIMVTLPDVSCERCVLQVMQVMYDKRPYEIGGNDNYYRCADIAITGGSVPDAGTPDAGRDAGGADVGRDVGGADADRDAALDVGDGGAADGSTFDSGEVAALPGSGCGVVSAGSNGHAAFVLCLAALFWRRIR